MSGSLCATQSSFGAVKPGIARLPAMRCNSGARSVSSAHSLSLRMSFQRIAGRSTRSLASSSTAPCICPERPMPRTCANSAGNFSRSAKSAVRVPSHQSSGFCSAQRGFGRETVNGVPAVPMTLPSLASSRTFTSDVPRSIPRYMNEPLSKAEGGRRKRRRKAGAANVAPRPALRHEHENGTRLDAVASIRLRPAFRASRRRGRQPRATRVRVLRSRPCCPTAACRWRKPSADRPT